MVNKSRCMGASESRLQHAWRDQRAQTRISIRLPRGKFGGGESGIGATLWAARKGGGLAAGSLSEAGRGPVAGGVLAF